MPSSGRPKCPKAVPYAVPGKCTVNTFPPNMKPWKMSLVSKGAIFHLFSTYMIMGESVFPTWSIWLNTREDSHGTSKIKVLGKGNRSSKPSFSGSMLIWVVVSDIFHFHRYLGKIPILTKIFQMGWNHQPENNMTRRVSPGQVICEYIEKEIPSPALMPTEPWTAY